MDSFIKWLNSEMEKRDWKQADLARQANLDSAAISMLLSKRRQPGEVTCRAIARALRMPPETVFRAAGLLPSKPESDPRMEQIGYILPRLPERDRDEILAFVELKLKLAEQRGEYNPD